MVQSKSGPARHGNAATTLLFEHPLAERVRSFLRLEAVLAETRKRMAWTSAAGGRAALASLIELAAITERTELKREILTELDRQHLFLAQLANSAEVDTKRLNQALYSLEQVQSTIEAMPKRLGRMLKASEFLSTIQSRSMIPGGGCAFDLPALHYWLARPAADRQADLTCWLEELAPVEEALAVLLGHIREAAVPQPATATGGIYEYSPPRENAPVLLRIMLDTGEELYPKVSGGRHRVTIQFEQWQGIGERPELLRRDVKFTLAVCRL
ncbi:MAG: cell division protein ZapD [Gammaproteobacteria bacterium]